MAPAPTATAACRRACEEAQPPQVDPACPNVSVDTCADLCLSVVPNPDAACQECVAATISWFAGMNSCSPIDCYCSGARPAFDRSECDTACAASLERAAEQRLAQPEPEPSGHQPTRRVDLGVGQIESLSASDRYGLWAVVRVAPRALELVEMDLEAGIVKRVELIENQGSPWEVHPHDSGIVVAGRAAGGNRIVSCFDQQGELLWMKEVASASPVVGYSQAWAGLGGFPEGVLAVAVSDSIEYWDEQGEVISGDSIPPGFLGTRPEERAYALDGAGGLFVAETSTVGMLSYFPTGWQQDAVSNFTLEFDGEEGGGSTHAVRPDDEAAVYVTGARRVERSRIEFSKPFLSRVDNSGRVIFEWSNSELITGWDTQDFVPDEAGNVYLVTAEDPVEYALEPPRSCSTYGCDAVAVRKLSQDGTVRWYYDHGAYSYGGGVALGTTGTVIVAGTEFREDTAAFLLLFAAE